MSLTIRNWSIRHANKMERLYEVFEWMLLVFEPILRRLGYSRIEKPVAKTESLIKGILFDCQMCGDCILSSTGMSCSMNCPKEIRNGPCGGVRSDGNCEVVPDMPCVWVQAYEGSKSMRNKDGMLEIQGPVSRDFHGSSSWLRVVREKQVRNSES